MAVPRVSRPLVFLFFGLVKVLRAISPRYPNLNGLLHKSIHWGLRTFGSPECNTLILRHFHVGTELLAFMKANAGIDPALGEDHPPEAPDAEGLWRTMCSSSTT